MGVWSNDIDNILQYLLLFVHMEYYISYAFKVMWWPLTASAKGHFHCHDFWSFILYIAAPLFSPPFDFLLYGTKGPGPSKFNNYPQFPITNITPSGMPLWLCHKFLLLPLPFFYLVLELAISIFKSYTAELCKKDFDLLLAKP